MPLIQLVIVLVVVGVVLWLIKLLAHINVKHHEKRMNNESNSQEKRTEGKEHAQINFYIVLHHGYTADVFMFGLCRFICREIWYDSTGYQCGQSL